MSKKRVKATLSFDAEIYKNFQKYCSENAIMLSRTIEMFMDDFYKKKRKKLTLGILFFIFFINLATAATIFSDNFEDSNIAGWTTTGGVGNWHANNTGGPIDPPIDSWHMISSGSNDNIITAEASVSTDGYESIVFSFYYKPDTNDLECGTDYLRADWYDGSTWNNVLDICGNVATTYTLDTNNLNSAAEDNANFKIRFVCKSGAVTTEGCAIDNIEVTGNVIPDPDPPVFSNFVEGPSNGSAYSSGQVYRFNVTITESSINLVGIEFNGTNYTSGNITNSSNVYIFNISNLAAGTYPYYWWANDTNQNYNSSGIRYYTNTKATGNISLLLNGVAANLSVQYPQQSNISSATLFGTVSIYQDGTLISSQNGLNLTRGSGFYNITAISSGDQNHSSASITYWLNITKALGNVSLLLNGNSNNLTIQYPQQINASASTLYGSVSLYRDGTDISASNSQNSTLGVNYYNFTALSSGDQNHSSAAITYFANITKGNIIMTLLLNGVSNNLSLVYLNNLNASATSSGGSVALYRDDLEVSNSQNVVLGVGFYQYKANATGNSNYSDNSSGIIFYANITKASPSNLQISINPSNNEIYGTPTRATATESNTGDGDLSYRLFRNNTLIASASPWEEVSAVTLGAGSYLYTFNTSGGSNYTSGNTTLTLTIEKASNALSLLLNGNSNNITIQYPQQVNITGTSTSSILSLFRNNTDITAQNGLNTTLNPGFYEIKINSTGNQNYSANSSEIKYYLNITPAPDTSAPQITIASPSEGQTFGTNTTLALNYSIIEDNIDSCWFNIDNGSNQTLAGCANSTFNTSSGSHTLNLFANDSSGNLGKSNVNFTIQIGAPTISLITPTSNTYLNYQNISFSFAASDPDGISSCQLYGDFGGSFSLNQTNNSIISGVTSRFFLNLTDSTYSWNIRCNDTLNFASSSSNRSFTIDTLNPGVTLTSPSGSYSSLSNIPLILSVDESSPSSCTYNVMKGASFEIANSSIECNSTSFSVSSEGNYLLNLYVEDSAGNTNFTNSSFSVTIPSSGPPQGGSSGGGGGGSGGGATPSRNASVIVESLFLTENILKQGSEEKLRLQITNIGKNYINACKLQFSGSSSSWLSNQEIKGLSIGEKYVYEIAIQVPLEVEPGSYSLGITLKCDEGNSLHNSDLFVYRNTFEGEIIDYRRDGNNLIVDYSLTEFAGLEHEINIKYSLSDLSGALRFSDQHSTTLSSREVKEENLEFRLPKDSFGEFNLIFEFDDGFTIIPSNKTIFLPSSATTAGLVISEANRRRLSIAGATIISLFFLFFAVRFIFRHHEKTRIMSGMPSRKYIRINLR